MASSLQNCFLHPLSGGEDSHCERDGTFHYLLEQFLKILSVAGDNGEYKGSHGAEVCLTFEELGHDHILSN